MEGLVDRWLHGVGNSAVRTGLLLDDSLLVAWCCYADVDSVGGCGLLAFGLVCAAIEDGVQLIGVVLSKTTDGPWVGVIGITAALSELAGWHDHAVSHGHSEVFLEVIQLDWSLRDCGDGVAVFDQCAVHGSGAG